MVSLYVVWRCKLIRVRVTAPNADGRYEIENLPAGCYTLTVVPMDGILFAPKFTTPVCGPDNDGNPQLVKADFLAVSEQTYSISGRVFDTAGQGVPGVQISLGNQVVVSANDGSYEFEYLPAGTHVVTPDPKEFTDPKQVSVELPYNEFSLNAVGIDFFLPGDFVYTSDGQFMLRGRTIPYWRSK